MSDWVEMHRYIPDILERLTDAYGKDNVILAGGAVRDYTLNKPIKDYDFFIHGDPERNPMGVVKLGDDNEYYENNTYIEAVYNAPFIDKALKVELIFTRCPCKEAIKEFDYDICECYYDPMLEDFVYTKNFHKAVDTKIITCNKKIPNGTTQKIQEYEKKFNARLNRMQKKFKEYNFKIEDNTIMYTTRYILGHTYVRNWPNV